MTVLVINHHTAPGRIRALLARVMRALDVLVSDRAAREVPEWRMREVQAEIARYSACRGQLPSSPTSLQMHRGATPSNPAQPSIGRRK